MPHRPHHFALIAIIAVGMIFLGFLIFSSPPQETSAPHTPLITLVSHFFPVALAPAPHSYIEVTAGCNAQFAGGCVNVRSAATTTARAVAQLRTGIVLSIDPNTEADATGRLWHKVTFNEWVRYPERVKSDWYVAADFVRPFTDVPQEIGVDPVASTTKHILIDRSEQKIYAYEGNALFMESAISTGLDLTPTPRGMFTVYKKTPSRYMQGPLPGISTQYYDLPGVPWNLYFTKEGGAIHGAYWHTQFGKQWSHGCVNLPLDAAHTLYDWTPIGTPVLVRD